MSKLISLLDKAKENRVPLLEKLAEEQTDSLRLFHGVVEGWPGLTIDQYGSLVLAQSFREVLEPKTIALLAERFGDGFVYNHRGDRTKRFSYHTPPEQSLEPALAKELGLLYSVSPRHKGRDPHLFLDLRVARRWLKTRCEEKSVLNLFAYSCGLGQVALSGGASEVWNVDFSASALEVGKANLELNGLSSEQARFIQEDFFPVAWQLSGLGLRGKKARRRFLKLKTKRFDLVLLDPPARAKGPFQMVDLINDYQSLFKPALLCCSRDGQLVVTNNVASVSRADFEDILTRCAKKAERPLKSLKWLTPDEDFPSFDGNHPLKIAVCRV